jgi:hypothetical protein
MNSMYKLKYWKNNIPTITDERFILLIISTSLPNYISIYGSTALVNLSRFFQFFNLHTDSLDGEWALLKAATYTQNSTQTSMSQVGL